jgi:hypothetical protein
VYGGSSPGASVFVTVLVNVTSRGTVALRRLRAVVEFHSGGVFDRKFKFAVGLGGDASKVAVRLPAFFNVAHQGPVAVVREVDDQHRAAVA